VAVVRRETTISKLGKSNSTEPPLVSSIGNTCRRVPTIRFNDPRGLRRHPVNMATYGDTPKRIDVVEVVDPKVSWCALVNVSTRERSRFPSVLIDDSDISPLSES